MSVLGAGDRDVGPKAQCIPIPAIAAARETESHREAETGYSCNFNLISPHLVKADPGVRMSLAMRARYDPSRQAPGFIFWLCCSSTLQQSQ